MADRTTQRTWMLFTDWCAACDLDPLPASPQTLAEFLSDHPARLGTQRRRVAAIDGVHRRRDLPEPGRAHAVQAALAARRAERLSVLDNLIEQRIALLPTTSWPAGMFGRRDALILTLVRAGLTYTEVATLRRGELRQSGDAIEIDARRQCVLESVIDSPADPVAVYRRWTQVQALLDGFASPRTLAYYFDQTHDRLAQTAIPPLTEKSADEPLIVRIDRWGYTPLLPTPMTEQSVAGIACSHLVGTAPSHRRRTRPRPASIAPPKTQPDMRGSVRLDDRYHRRGLEARRRAHTELAEVEDILDTVNARAEQLLEELAAVFGDVPDAVERAE
ncbi:hypothetical protein [Mycobacterium sp. URHB0021]